MEQHRLMADALAYQNAVCACERTSSLSAGRAAIRLLDRLSSGAAFRWLKKSGDFGSENQKDVEKTRKESGVTAVGSPNATQFGWGQSKLEAKWRGNFWGISVVKSPLFGLKIWLMTFLIVGEKFWCCLEVERMWKLLHKRYERVLSEFLKHQQYVDEMYDWSKKCLWSDALHESRKYPRKEKLWTDNLLARLTSQLNPKWIQSRKMSVFKFQLVLSSRVIDQWEMTQA